MTGGLMPGLGPGSQKQEDDVALDYMKMPEGMMTYHMPSLPPAKEAALVSEALQRLEQVLEALRHFRSAHPGFSVNISDLDHANTSFIDEVLGEGEVSIIAGSDRQIQESVLAGVWRARLTNADGTLVRDVIEIGHFPSGVIPASGFPAGIRPPADQTASGLLAAPSLLAELHAVLTGAEGDTARHAINLSLLPHTEEDLAFLEDQLGGGTVHVLSRGYGNCRISSTGTRNVWWVRYFNSEDVLILNTLEICTLPDVAQAAVEDIDDSAQRLSEILDIYR
jgi:hydrogenase-1 operon protein HyaF